MAAAAAEDAAAAAAAAKDKKLRAIIGGLMDMATASAVAKERAAFLVLMRNEIERVNDTLAESELRALRRPVDGGFASVFAPRRGRSPAHVCGWMGRGCPGSASGHLIDAAMTRVHAGAHSASLAAAPAAAEGKGKKQQQVRRRARAWMRRRRSRPRGHAAGTTSPHVLTARLAWPLAQVGSSRLDERVSRMLHEIEAELDRAEQTISKRHVLDTDKDGEREGRSRNTTAQTSHFAPAPARCTRHPSVSRATRRPSRFFCPLVQAT